LSARSKPKSRSSPDPGTPSRRKGARRFHDFVRFEALLAEMTLEEEISLRSGADFWSLRAFPRIGLGKPRVTDGPNGARGGGSFIGGVTSAAFPVGVAIGKRRFARSQDSAEDAPSWLDCEPNRSRRNQAFGLEPRDQALSGRRPGRHFQCFTV
jgi:hypothetical protein